MNINPVSNQRSLGRNRTAWILTFSHFSHDLCSGILPALIPFIRDALGLEYVQAGGLLAALTITTGVSQFIGGWLGDRFQRRRLVAIGLAGVGSCTFIVSQMDSYGLLIGIFIVTGLFAGLYHPSSVVLLSDRTDPDQQGKAMSFHMVGGSLGYMVAPLAGGVLANYLGWQAAFMFLCIPALLAAGLSLFFLTNTSSHGSILQSEATEVRGSAPWYRIIILCTMSVLIEVVSGAAVAFFSLFLVDVQGLTAASSTLGLGLLRAGSLVGSILGGFVSDRWGDNRAVISSFVASGPVLLVLSWLSGIPFFISLFFFGFFYMMREVTVQIYLLKSTPLKYRSRIIGVYFGFGMEGSSIIQPVVGHAMDSFGISSVYIWLGIASTAVSMLLPVLMLMKGNIPRLSR